MKLTLFLLLLTAVSALAQPGAPQPPLLACGTHGDAEVICGTRSPEDFEVTPDGKFLIVANFGQGNDVALDLFNLSSEKFTEMTLTSEPQEGWGTPGCGPAINSQITPHGLSLTQRTGGAWQLYVVNHGGRQSMEMYEIRPLGDSWEAVWRGCVLAREGADYNDVAARPDGSFVATRPLSIQNGAPLFGGQPTGNVARWTPQAGETLLPGTEMGYPNGVLVSEDGRFAYISGWTTRDIHKYDLSANREVSVTKLDFMPDNITWTPDGKLMAAGIKGTNGNCPEGSNTPCIQGFGVTIVDPATMTAEPVFDSAGKGALIGGVSVAIETGANIYVGAFQGDRIVKLAH